MFECCFGIFYVRVEGPYITVNVVAISNLGRIENRTVSSKCQRKGSVFSK
jgi:hypothetical protein